MLSIPETESDVTKPPECDAGTRDARAPFQTSAHLAISFAIPGETSGGKPGASQRVLILSPKNRSRVRLRNFDRLLLVWLFRIFPAILNAIIVIKPETVIRCVLSHLRRGLVRVSVTTNPTTGWIAGQVTEAFP